MNIKISGKVVKILAEYTKNNYTSREFWVEVDADTQYPQTIKLEVSGKSLSMFGAMLEGDYVDAECNLKGKVYNDKCYNSISCWKATIRGKQSNANAQHQSQPQQQSRQEVRNTPPSNLRPVDMIDNANPVDDMPF